MSYHASRLATRSLVFASSLLLLAPPSIAQRPGTPPSDTSWIVPRVPLALARKSLPTRDAQAAVLLMDTTLVLQFTDHGLSRMKASVRDSAPQDVGQRLLDKTTAAVRDMGGNQKLQANAFARALNDEQKLVRQATGFRGVNALDDVMTPEQMAAQIFAPKKFTVAELKQLRRAVGEPEFGKLFEKCQEVTSRTAASSPFSPAASGMNLS